MDPVSKVGHLVEVLRKQLAESQKNTGVSFKAAGSSGAIQAGGQPSVEDLQKKSEKNSSASTAAIRNPGKNRCMFFWSRFCYGNSVSA